MTQKELKHPIDKYMFLESNEEITKKMREEWIQKIDSLSRKLRNLTENLSYQNLDWQCRPDGWSIKQLVHHLADSHMNYFLRFKLALTEESPVVKTYTQGAWAELEDGTSPEIESSLNIIEGLHERMKILLNNLSDTEWKKDFFDPDYQGKKTLEWTLGYCAWHLEHHMAQIKQAMLNEGVFVWEEA